MATPETQDEKPSGLPPEEKPSVVVPPEASTDEAPAFNTVQQVYINRMFGVDNSVLADTIRRIIRDAPGLADGLFNTTGAIVLWTTDTAPTGWVLCDGTVYNASTSRQYQPLFDVIGNVYGGADNTDFQVPDLRGRFPLGQDDMGGSSANRVTDTDADTLGGADGDETKSFSGATGTPSGSGSAAGGGAEATDANHTHSVTLSGQDIMPPFITLNYIIKI